jgi:hypothetical protein
VRAAVLQHATAAERLSGVERQLENTIERLKERAEGLRREASAPQAFTPNIMPRSKTPVAVCSPSAKN